VLMLPAVLLGAAVIGGDAIGVMYARRNAADRHQTEKHRP
jgi:hypothetical protein